jgi:hypothetical protein
MIAILVICHTRVKLSDEDLSMLFDFADGAMGCRNPWTHDCINNLARGYCGIG